MSGGNISSGITFPQGLPVSVVTQTATPVAAGTVNATQGVNTLILTPAGTLLTLTVNFPTSPYEGQRFTLFSSQILTGLTLAAGAGTILGTLTTLAAANGFATWQYNLAATTWYRIG